MAKKDHRLQLLTRDILYLNGELDHIRSQYQQALTSLNRLEHKFALLQTIVQRVNTVRRRRHTLTNFVRSPEGVLLGKMENLFGMHPLDVEPSLKPKGFPIRGQTVKTYYWLYDFRKESDNVLQKIIDPYYVQFENWQFDGGGQQRMPIVDGPGLFVQAYDPDPPDPKDYDSGILRLLQEYRTSVFYPHLTVQNAGMKIALNNWWQHVRGVTSIISDFLKIMRDEN